MTLDPLFLVVVLVAEIFGTLAGFGSSTILLPLSLFFFADIKVALVLVAFAHFFGNLARVGFFRHGIEKNLIIKFGIPSIIFALIGATLVSSVPQNTLRGILGIFLIIDAGLTMLHGGLKLKPSARNSAIGGSLSGLLAGLTGIGGPIRAAFLTAFNLKKNRYIATSTSIAVLVDVTRIPVYLSQGFLDAKYLVYLPPMLVIAFVGTYLGKFVVDHESQDQFKKVVLVVLLGVGSKFVYDWLSSMLY